METPPPYNPPKKKSNTGLIIGIVLGTVAICCIGGLAVLIGGGAWLVGKALPTGECMMSFQFAQRAMIAYAKDHDGVLPKAETWQDDIKEYYGKQSAKIQKDQSGPVHIKLFPAEGEWVCKNDGGSSGIAFNTDLAGKKLEDVSNPYQTALLFEVPTSGRNQHQKYKQLPSSSSPKVLGNHRGWFVAPVEGDVMTDVDGKRKPMKNRSGGFEIDTDSSSSVDE